MSTYNESWLGRTISIVDSTDPTLLGRTGVVEDETKQTLRINEGDKIITLGKSSISFSIDGSQTVVQGALVNQRPEDRIHRKYRKA
ncbi:MAG: ribonuclease P protein subunit [Candidatus Poseidoniales archaeon]|jgi:RNase P/RNase MRP subunit p29|nr:ribonuclease P protein subunit [archaeon]MDA0842872.1 ribonuclease P protein subunit [archaeon]MDA1167708.1 ribonuclease P protein subunit [archaeon]